MSFLIRQVEAGDLTGVYAIEKECFHDPYPIEFLEHLIKTENSRFYVATQAGRIVGYAVATASGREGHVVSVAVDPSHRRMGMGAGLLASVTCKLVEAGVDRIHLEVRKGNRSAIFFYERMGFQRFSEIKRYYPDGEDAWVLTRQAESSHSEYQ